MISIADLCLLCHTNSKNRKNILSQDFDGVMIEEKLKFFLFEIIQAKLAISKQICLQCLEKLNFVYEFKHMCLRNIIKFNNSLHTLGDTPPKNLQITLTKQEIPKSTPERNQPVNISKISTTTLNLSNPQTQKDNSKSRDASQAVTELILAEIDPNNHEIQEQIITLHYNDSMDFANDLTVGEEIVVQTTEEVYDESSIKREPVQIPAQIPVQMPVLIPAPISAGIPGQIPIEVFPGTYLAEDMLKQNKSPKISDDLNIGEKIVVQTNEEVYKESSIKREPVQIPAQIPVQIPAGIPGQIPIKLLSGTYLAKDMLKQNKSPKISDDLNIGEKIVVQTTEEVYKESSIKLEPVQIPVQIPVQMPEQKPAQIPGQMPVQIPAQIPIKILPGTYLPKDTLKQNKSPKKLDYYILLTTTNQKPAVKLHQCNICDKIFESASAVTRHKVTHSGEKTFKCDICDKVFGYASSLQEHRSLHIDERPYKCEICDKAFNKLGNMVAHRRIHTDERPYKCTFCDKTFRQHNNRKNHIRRQHTGEKLYICDVCNKDFFDRGALTNHLRIHTGEKPYKCDECDQMFSSSNNLRCHKKTHSDGRTFLCDMCSCKFTNKTGLKNHCRRTHNKPAHGVIPAENV